MNHADTPEHRVAHAVVASARENRTVALRYTLPEWDLLMSRCVGYVDLGGRTEFVGPGDSWRVAMLHT